MKTLVSIFALSFLLIHPTYSQLYQLNRNFLETLETGDLNPNNVENLVIENIAVKESLVQSPSNLNNFLEQLKGFKELKVLEFENLRLISFIDTFYTFDPLTFDETIYEASYNLDLPPYGLLPLLNTFEQLEILELNFLDNEPFYKVCQRDFAWAVLRENIEQEMIEELTDCWKESTSAHYGNMPKERFNMWNWTQIEEEELIPQMVIPVEVLDKQDSVFRSYRIEENPWEWHDTLSDEEYCKVIPEFCDDNGKPFWDREEEEGIDIDTAFLKIIGEWPLEEEEKEQIDTVFFKEMGLWSEEPAVDDCWIQLQGNPRWKAYQAKCAELDDLYWKRAEGTEGLYQRLSIASQTLVDTKKDLTLSILEQDMQRSLLIKQFYYKELWEVLQLWKVKTRPELFLEQLGKLKTLKKLSISNNYMLDFEALVELIAEELPNLEVLEFQNCQLFNIPSNINKLKHLNVLNLKDNFIHNASSIQLPHLAILSLEGNQISEQEITILKDALPNCSLRF